MQCRSTVSPLAARIQALLASLPCVIQKQTGSSAAFENRKNRGDLYPSFRVMWVALPHYLGNTGTGIRYATKPQYIHTFRHADQQRLRALCLKSEPRKHI